MRIISVIATDVKPSDVHLAAVDMPNGSKEYHLDIGVVALFTEESMVADFRALANEIIRLCDQEEKP